MRTNLALIKFASRQVARRGGHLRSISGTIAIACAIAAPVLAQDDNRENSLLEFFAGQGCAIGPATRAAAISAGYNMHEIDLLSTKSRLDSNTVLTGEWLVLPPSMCKIKLPEVSTQLTMSDPEVIAAISLPDAYVLDGYFGCFLTSPAIFYSLQETRNWDEDTANIEVLRFISASLISGDLAFYPEDPLDTPPRFIVTSGDCANKTPLLPVLEREHQLLVKHFDAYIRAATVHIVCEQGASISFLGLDVPDIPIVSKNPWLGLEYQIITVGAGWFDGMSMPNRGTPRPPLCHYE